jgi:hypothetical protein
MDTYHCYLQKELEDVNQCLLQLPKKSLRRYVIANRYALLKHKKGCKEGGPKPSSYSDI